MKLETYSKGKSKAIVKYGDAEYVLVDRVKRSQNRRKFVFLILYAISIVCLLISIGLLGEGERLDAVGSKVETTDYRLIIVFAVISIVCFLVSNAVWSRKDNK